MGARSASLTSSNEASLERQHEGPLELAVMASLAMVFAGTDLADWRLA
jgi:hypothetical protein